MYLISGSKGFIASKMVEYLEDKGNTVIGYDIIDGYDLRDYGQLELVFKQNNIQQVYHIGGQAFLYKGEANPYYDNDVNVKGTINLVKLCIKYGASLLFTSTGAVYGRNEPPHREDMNCTPLCNYGVSKLSAEKYIQKHCITEDMDAKIVRFSSVYGEGRRHGAVNAFINKAKQGEPITIYGDGSTTRDYIHVDDVCEALYTVMNKGDSGEVYNVGSGVETSLLEVAGLVRRYLPVEIKMVEREQGKYDVQRNHFNIDKLTALGYSNQFTLKQGIEKLIGDKV